MLHRRERSAPPPSVPGEHPLPRGRVGIRAVALTLLALLTASCAARTAAEVPPTSSASPTATAVATGPGGIPLLGTTPPSGLVLPTFFVTLIDSTNGSVGVLTTPGSRCGLSVSAPSGTVSDYPAQSVGANGTSAFTYPPVTGHGQSIQTMRCTLGDTTGVAKGQVLLP